MKKWSIKSYINIQFHFFYETGARTIEDILKEKQISIFDGKTYEPDLGQYAGILGNSITEMKAQDCAYLHI